YALRQHYLPADAPVGEWTVRVDYEGVEYRHQFTVTNPAAVATGRETQAVLRILPNPFRSEAIIRIDGTDAPVRAFVSDASGRLVRLLRAGENPGILTWDARDDRGRLMPPGVYFVRVRTDTATHTRPILLVR
ncbi:MAG: T9SS type A sorting domain-containing protein, partial [Candidatus Eisenbacteria bacterium]|nr:T9SS type A sorting domain-containing protein [Candidatus Latescibacterota bacterium]MBD3301641.1 T9SS type A sorting domain-containing protein [Candidatus Eisenbacteria bacterium]